MVEAWARFPDKGLDPGSFLNLILPTSLPYFVCCLIVHTDPTIPSVAVSVMETDLFPLFHQRRRGSDPTRWFSFGVSPFCVHSKASVTNQETDLRVGLTNQRKCHLSGQQWKERKNSMLAIHMKQNDNRIASIVVPSYVALCGNHI